MPEEGMRRRPGVRPRESPARRCPRDPFALSWGTAGAGREAQGAPSPGGPHDLTHQHCPNCSHSQTFIIPGLAPCPLDLSAPCSAPLGRISRHTQDDVNSIQPCFYTALLGKPADHTAELLARPARLLGQGPLLLQLPNNGCWRELPAGLQGWFSHQVPQLVSPCHLSAQPCAQGPVIHRAGGGCLAPLAGNGHVHIPFFPGQRGVSASCSLCSLGVKG